MNFKRVLTDCFSTLKHSVAGKFEQSVARIWKPREQTWKHETLIEIVLLKYCKQRWLSWPNRYLGCAASGILWKGQVEGQERHIEDLKLIYVIIWCEICMWVFNTIYMKMLCYEYECIQRYSVRPVGDWSSTCFHWTCHHDQAEITTKYCLREGF